MAAFDDVKQKIEGVQRLTRLSETEAAALRSQHPGLPEDYVDFLVSVGYGDLGPLQLYSGPTQPGQVYPKSPPSLASLLLFGDDFQGYCFGFDVSESFRVVEVDPRGNVDRGVEGRFTELLRGYFG
jgi:hypothetical protein